MERRQPPSPNLVALLVAASAVAELSMAATLDEEARSRIFVGQGNVFDVPDEVSFYHAAASLPGVARIGEVGFNAGHSALCFLSAGSAPAVTSFDLGELPWTPHSVRFLQRAFPGRLDYHRGLSTDTLAAYEANRGPLFDLFAVDGGHSAPYPEHDMRAGRRLTRRGGYLLIDDYTDSFPDVKHAWGNATRQGWVREILCVNRGEVVNGFQKGYCLGQYVPDAS